MKPAASHQGFTLIQISILLLVASIVMVNILPSLQTSLNKNSATTTKMNNIVIALRQYEAVNAALPCPADASQPINSTSYGVAAGGIGATNNCTGSSPAANYVDSTNHVAIGMVPVRALALSNDYALDAYGYTITYAVDTNATSCFAGSLTGQITVTDNGAAANTIAALVSHGKDGHGAWIPLPGSTGTAVRLNAGSTDTDQLTNAHVDSSFNPTTTLTNFVRKPQTTTFDDLLVYQSLLWNLNTAPVASSSAWPTISPPANGTYGSGQVLSFTVTFKQSVIVTGTPYLSLSAITGSIGTGNVAKASYASGSGTTALTFSYTIVGADSAPTGLTILPTIYLNGGTMTANGDPVCLPFTAPNLSGVIIASNIWVADYSGNQIVEFNTSGTALLTFGTQGVGNGQFEWPNYVTLDASGNVWVSDEGNCRLEKFNSSGTYQSQIGSCGTTNGKFKTPGGGVNTPGIAFDSSGNIWAVDMLGHRVEKFNSAGVYQSQIGKCASGACTSGAGNGQFNNPTGIAIDASGNIWVVDYGNSRVQKFNSAGVYQSQFGACCSGNGNFFDPEYMTIDASGNLWVADTGNNRVEEFNSSGTYLAAIGAGYNGVAGSVGSSGAGNGQLNGPYAVAVDSSGNIWVADSSNNRVQEFNSSRTYVQKFGSSQYNGIFIGR